MDTQQFFCDGWNKVYVHHLDKFHAIKGLKDLKIRKQEKTK
jgi:hypothetical protein